MIYTYQKSKLSKKQRAAREALLQEQRAIKRSLKTGFEPLTLSFTVPAGRETRVIKSVGNGFGVAAAPAPKVYTGDKMIGIGQLHKSNAVPVFKQEDAQDLARMRR